MKKIRGFTLVELLVGLAIVAILATYAMPAYNSVLKRSRLTEAKANLMTLQASLERYFKEYDAYPNSLLLLKTFTELGLDQHSDFKFYLDFSQSGCTKQNCYVLVAEPHLMSRQDEELTVSATGYKTGAW